MKKKIILFLLLLLFIPFNKVKAINLTYQAHVQTYGWLSPVNENELGGTEKQAKRMEGLKIFLDDSEYEGSITYQAHIQGPGWVNWVNNGELAGTEKQAKRMEAIRIKLTGDLAEHYSIYYRAHVQTYGWLSWVRDGEMAGTEKQAKRMEGIQIKLVRKDNRDLTASYTVRNGDGWGNYVNNGDTSGTTGQFKKIDMLKIKLNNNTNYTGGINYQTYATNKAWLPSVGENGESGYTGKTLEAVKISLTGDFEKYFNIFYRVHVSTIGWMDWTSNGSPAGSIGYYYKIEAIEIKILPKDDTSIKISSNAYKEHTNKVLYSTYVQGGIWQDFVSEGLSGTERQGKRAEAFKIKFDAGPTGNVIYKTYIAKRGWSSEVKNGEMSGTMNLSRKLEAISIKLDGKMEENFDIYYRVHVQTQGWLSWAKNGGYAGTLNNDRGIEGLEIKLVEKGIDPKLDTSKPLLTGSWQGSSYVDYYGKRATGFKLIDGVKYYFNPEGKQYGKNVQKIIDVSSWQGTINWDMIKKNEDVDAAIIRVGWGTSYNDPCGLDSYFDRNIKEVQRLGIPYGIYIYAYAETTQAAQKEADFVLSKMKQYNMPKNTYVWYDAEISSIPRSTYNTVIPAFINRIKSSGYNNVGVYSGVRQLDTTNGNTNTPTIRSYPIWVSQYYKDLQYTGTYKGWQYASDEHIDGIEGNVDVSMFFK